MDIGGYWSGVMRSRLSRRRALAATGATAAGAALLAACGGGDDDGDDKNKDVSGLLTPITDETKNLKRGGVYKLRSNQDPVAFEPQTFVNSTATTYYCYSNLFTVKDGYMERSAGEIVGDVVESWEFSGDRLTLTAKISPNAHWTPQAPTNGRVVDAKDVEASWQRVKTISTRRSELAYEVNPAAPIVSITATDDRTIVIKLSEPTATILSLLATAAPGMLMLGPKEILDPSVLDLRTTVRGSGPWYLSELQSGAFFTFKRNPGYKQDKREVPYVDEVSWPIVIDYSAAVAQFRAGNIYTLAVPGSSTAFRNEDIVGIKRDVPEIEMSQTDLRAAAARQLFGVSANSPFKDERVRQAWVLTWDRDLFLDTYFNVQTFRDQGLPAETAYEGSLAANSWKGWFLDPQSKDFGPNAKYFNYDEAEAKKLLAAAGYPNGVDVELNLPANGPDLPQAPQFFRTVDIIMGMVTNSGLFRINRKDWRFQLEFQPRFRDAKGNIDGAAMNLAGLPAPDPITALYQFYHPAGGIRQGTDSTLEDLINKANREFDVNKRQQLGYEVQRYEAGKQFFPLIAASTTFDLAWPIVRNRGVWQGDQYTYHQLTSLFLDPERPPAKRA
jgi:ABC-type transport system substrate-binding protein